ncbi:BppU family phage baseplate upper protein [Mammaliicoccus lentus]|uniref:BppU family phage baseplate upper protein n=1 Tax=Mammaliicoccus lentus TaxID=42858 RepID=UPI0009DA2F60
MTRNGSPLLVSSENADVFLILKNGKNYIVDNVEPIDPMNGRLKYTIPNEFLGLTGKVNGQLYIAVHGKEDIVTEVEFSFKIADSLINTIPAVDKLNEIRTFQEFRESIMTTINEINEALDNGKDYVTQMEATKASGMKALNDRTTQAIEEITTLVGTSTQEITDLKDNTISELDDKATQIKNDVEELNQYDTTNWQKYKLTNDDGTSEIVSLGNDLDALRTLKPGFYYTTTTPIGTSYSTEWASSTGGYTEVFERDGVTKQIIFKPYNSNQQFIMRYYNEWTGWERINPDMRRKWLGTLGTEGSPASVLDLDPGIYECSIPADAFTVDAPQDPNGSGYIAEIDVTEGAAGKRKQFKLIANGRNNEYRGTVHTSNAENPDGQFMGWKKVQNEEEYNALFSDTGWIDWNTMNGATKRETDNPNALQCQRRIRTVNGVKIAHLRVNVNNVVTQTTFGSIPADMVPKVQNFYIRTPVSMNPAVLFVDIDGTLKFYCNLNDTSKWLPGHYIIGEFSWIIDDIGGGQ